MNLTARDGGAEYDCRRCGACCARYAVNLYPDELPGWPPEELAGDAHGTYLAGTMTSPAEARCLHLVGAVGWDVACAAHWRRPRVCRQFDPGSHYCRLARAQHGLPVRERRLLVLPTYLVHRWYALRRGAWRALGGAAFPSS